SSSSYSLDDNNNDDYDAKLLSKIQTFTEVMSPMASGIAAGSLTYSCLQFLNRIALHSRGLVPQCPVNIGMIPAITFFFFTYELSKRITGVEMLHSSSSSPSSSSSSHSSLSFNPNTS